MAWRSTPNVPSTAPSGRSEVEQHRPLLDVQFEIGGGILEFLAALLHALEIHADLLQRVRQSDAVLVLQAARLVHVEVARAGGRAEQALAEARAFFVGPIHQADGDGRLALVLGVDAAENFHPGQHVEAAVEPAAVGHRIHVAADQQRTLGFAAQGRPEIAGGIGVDFDGQRRELLPQPGARLDPLPREGDALRAVFVGGEAAQFLEFGHRPFRVQRSAHAIESQGVEFALRLASRLGHRKEPAKSEVRNPRAEGATALGCTPPKRATGFGGFGLRPSGFGLRISPRLPNEKAAQTLPSNRTCPGPWVWINLLRA